MAVRASADAPEVFEGTEARFTAIATGGMPPYLFRWDLHDGPADADLSDATSAAVTTDPLPQPGRYVFRVVTTDSEGSHATAFVTVDARSAVNANAPALARVGEPVVLTVELDDAPAGATVEWRVVQGTASLTDPTSPNPTLTTSTGETVVVRLTTTLPSVDGSPTVATRSFEIASVFDLHPRVRIETNRGEITLELDAEAAPLHAANFLLYVDDGFYEGLLFHRNACSVDAESGECEPFVLQGGAYRRVNEELELRAPTRDPVPSEADNGLSNGVVYSVALALGGGDPDSGTTQFFINLDADNGFLDEQDFTVYAVVVDGTDVVDAIVAAERTDSPIIFGEMSLPVEDVIIQRIVRVTPG